MNSGAGQNRFSLIESIPPSADLCLAATPVQTTSPPQSSLSRPRYRPHEIDSFLADLEPSIILEALVASRNGSTQTVREYHAGKEDRCEFIKTTVARASTSEKAWGIKAAHAGQRIGEWHDELVSWPWPKLGQPNGFLVQYNENQLTESIPPAGSEAHRASISSRQIEEYERKVEEIRKCLETLELDDLKAYVRTVHVTPHLQRSSQQSPAEAASYDNMDDFTALVTATIVQSLPKLARLSSLMDTWSIRFMIMRMIPDFIRDMDSCKDSMLSAQMAIGTQVSQTGTAGSLPSTRKPFSRNVFIDMRAVLSDQISETGKKVDVMLDLLEGSNDVLPEEWIDDMDNLEGQHETWVVNAEELVLDGELATAKAKSSQEESLARLESTSPASQHLQISDDDARIIGILHGQTDTGEMDANQSGISCIFANDEPTHPLSTEIIIPLPVRNVSRGVRKPTGIPADTSTEATKPIMPSKQNPLAIETQVLGGESNATSDPLSCVSSSGSVDSGLSSTGSSPEIQSAKIAAYSGLPTQITTPSSNRLSADFPNVSKRSASYDRNIRQSWSGAPQGSTQFAGQPRNRSSTFAGPQPPRSRHCSLLVPENAVTRFSMSNARPRSASIKSFEVIPHSEVRTIEVRRSLGNSSSASPSRPELVEYPFPQGSASDKIPALGSGVPGSAPETSLLGRTIVQDRFVQDDHPAESSHGVIEQTPETEPAQISFAKIRDPFGSAAPFDSPIRKRAHQQRAATLGDLASPDPTKASRSMHEDSLDAQISSILTKIPTNIRLTSAAEAATTDSVSKPMSSLSDGKSSKLRRSSVARLIRPRVSSPTAQSMTLAPASLDSKSNSNSEIRIYHLHKPGSTSPTKLHIRLVGGTGERVMVRVGGGWADFAEYLKEYALHHGKRAVSESHFNIRSLPQTSSPVAVTASTARPPSSSSNPLFRRQQTTPASIGAGDPSSVSPSWTPPTGSGTSDPRPSSSRGTWSPASEADSPNRHLGLAGPKTRKVDISPSKQAWVDGMMRQARRTSGGGGGGSSEGANEGKGARVGGVKRVLLGIGGRTEGR